MIAVLDAESIVEMQNGKAKPRIISAHNLPEIVNNTHCTTASDVWILGTTFAPFVDKSLISLVQTMTDADPKKRPNITHVIEQVQRQM